MIKKIPIAAAWLPLSQLISAFPFVFSEGKRQYALAQQFSAHIKRRHVIFLNSGLAGFYIILQVLKKLSSGKEVILPAYTAGSLVIAVKKAGLRPVLCDICPDDFNMDIDSLSRIVSGKTLCIVGVHMFGIACRGIGRLKGKFPHVFIIEDACQSQGTRIDDNPVGQAGDVSFFSFNKGKNMPTFGGGCVATDSEELYKELNRKCAHLKDQGALHNGVLFLKLNAFSLAVNPFIYGLLHPFICRFKETAPPSDVLCGRYTDFQAAVAEFQLKRIDMWAKKRYENGMRMIGELAALKEIMLPKIPQNTLPAFNRLPIVFRDVNKQKRVQQNLWQAGIETSPLYGKPLHHMFDLGYAWGNFPNAVYLAGHLLTIPSHPLLTEADITKIISVIKES